MWKKLNKFQLLMWKNFLLQWRHPKQTAVEILAPVIFAMLLVVLRSLVHPDPHSANFFTPFKMGMVYVDRAKVLKMPWSPSTNPYLQSIMHNTAEALNEGVHFNKIKLVMCTDSKKLESYTKTLIGLDIMAGIQFDDSLAGKTQLPSNLNVTIRFPSELRDYGGSRNWRTNTLYPPYQMPGPRNWMRNEGADPEYNGEGFLKIQEELSLSIINYFKSSFDRTSVNVYMQRFAYPKWTQDILLQALQAFVGLIIMLSFVYTCINTVKVITMEKERQLKEAMKIMGLPGWLHWTAWFFKTLIFLVITIIIMVVLIKVKWYPESDYTVFTYSNAIIIFLFLLLFVCATITFCFAISVFFSKANTAATIAGMMWFLSYFPYMLLQDKYSTMSLLEKLLASLCSNSAMAYGVQLIIMFEGIEEGVQWHNLWRSTTPDDNLVLGHIMIMLVVDTMIYFVLAIYVEAVFPGKYGVPQPWYFPITRSYWCGHLTQTGIYLEKSKENECYEEEPTHLHAGIMIQGLRKEFFNKKVAVENLFLNIYQDQITVLLGHNGAGKTTTMSMLTGMFPPTSGTAIVGGYDIRRDMARARRSLGLCPQHNILFDELTVKEHLYFYGRLKGVTKDEISEEISKYVKLLDLIPKTDAKSSTLSGGMKRKLSVGIALCGGSNVIMCDEPTAGMDPAARRALWDLLQSQKKGRTILLTTHFMDEADLLGDRIAIMSNGKLQCSGSSFFLKKQFGTGYHLVMDKSPQCDVTQITSLLQKHVPEIQVKSNAGSELTYVLNEGKSHLFEKMLSELEENKGDLGVLSYGISLTTLEDVFMKVGANSYQEEKNAELLIKKRPSSTDENKEHSKDDALFENGLENLHSSRIKLTAEETLLTGWPLWRNQFVAMCLKRTLSIFRSRMLFLIQNCIPILFLVLAILIIRSIGKLQELPNLKIDLDTYHNPVTVLTQSGINQKHTKYAEKYIEYLNQTNKAFINWENEDMSKKMLEETEKNTSTVRVRYITGASFTQHSITAWFNNDPLHSPPLALQLVLNAIFKEELSSNHSIQLNSHPLPFTARTKLKQLFLGSNMGFQLAFNVGFSMAFVSAFYVMFYIRERVVKAKHLQFVSGVGVFSFWASAFICDLITFVFTSTLLTATLAIFQEEGFRTVVELGRFFSILLYFGFSMIPMMYLGSYCFDVPSSGYTRMTLINIFTGVAAFIVVQILSQVELKLQHIADVLHWILLLIPHYSLTTGIRDVYITYTTNKYCSLFINAHETENQNCNRSSTGYYDWASPGIGRNVAFSISTGIVLITTLLLIEYRVFDSLQYKIVSNHFEEQNDEDADDGDVLEEKRKIMSLSTEEIKKSDLVMRDVTKYYKKFLAVNNICLRVNRFECFGLLGINGAGKTTTFKMMTGDIKFSSGDAWINGLSLKTDMKEIYKSIGYCPQFDALLDDLTCKETITVFGLLRGLTFSDCKLEADKLARDFDFRLHLNKKVKELSGGNRRKLSTSIALIGDPLVIYLDEPTTGMDPGTKRYLWNALCKVRDTGKCIVLTSHSMEECEALCTRIAIMVNGKFKCLGSTQHLKSKLSEGYVLIVKVRKEEKVDVELEDDLVAIETFVKCKFPTAVVREKHQQLVTFYIPDKKMPWSQMFGIMERGKQDLNIEDYSLGQSSLEQVFLSFTKYQREE